jgi:hypothetical protein
MDPGNHALGRRRGDDKAQDQTTIAGRPPVGEPDAPATQRAGKNELMTVPKILAGAFAVNGAVFGPGLPAATAAGPDELDRSRREQARAHR